MADHDERDEPAGEAQDPEDADATTDTSDGEADGPAEADDAAPADDASEDDADRPAEADDIALADDAPEDDADGEATASTTAEGDGADGAADDADDRDRAEVLAVYASARLVDTDAVVGAIAFDPDASGRDLQDGRQISGWSVFAGEETDEELEDAERLRLPSLAWVLQRDPAVALVTSGHDGSAGYWARHGERDDGLPNWVRIVP